MKPPLAHRDCISKCVWGCVYALTDQVDGSLVEGGGLQDLLHGDRFQFVRVQLLTLVRYAVVHDHRQRADPRLLIVRSPFLKEEKEMLLLFVSTFYHLKHNAKIEKKNLIDA